MDLEQKIFYSYKEGNFEEIKNIHGDDALRWAAQKGHLDLVEFLIAHGANIHADDNYPLHTAIENGHLEIVKLLVENGANLYIQNEDILRLASSNGYLDIVKYLIEKGANVHMNDSDALHWTTKINKRNSITQLYLLYMKMKNTVLTLF